MRKDKIFNGRRYYFHEEHFSKSLAQEVARRLHKRNYFVRVVKVVETFDNKKHVTYAIYAVTKRGS